MVAHLRSLGRRVGVAVRRFFGRHGAVVLITLVALGVRLVWNLRIHPPHDYAFSDMGGYFDRSLDFVRQPLTETNDYLSFFPWGTHAFMGLVRALFGAHRCTRDHMVGCGPLDASFAVLGALSVTYVTLLARRFAPPPGAAARGARRRFFPWFVGLFAAVHYPFVAQSGIFLSEGPFTLCLAAVAYHSLRAVDEGRRRDLFWIGLWTGLGAIVRPQMLASLGLLGLFWFWRRKQWRARITVRKAAWAALPLGLVLLFSAVRTTRHHRRFQPNGFALVSTNDALNYAFGRCHTIGIEARMRGYGGGFGPPSLGGLYFNVEALKKKHVWTPFELKPALPPDLRCNVNVKHASKKEPPEPCISFEGKMWSRDVLRRIADDCVKKTGLARQAYYAVTHVVLNFAYNGLWPGNPLPKWRGVAESWPLGFGVSVLPLALLTCFLGFHRRWRRHGLLALHLWAVTVVAAIYFGEVRLRTPYDAVAIVLGFDLLARAGAWCGRRILARMGGLAPAPRAHAPAFEPSPAHITERSRPDP